MTDTLTGLPDPSRDAVPPDAAVPGGRASRRGRRMAPGILRVALAAASGLLLTLAFPGIDWWPLAPVSVALLALAVRGARPRAAAGLGLVAAFAFFVIHLHWSGIYVGPLPWFALALVESLYLAAMAAALPWTWRAPLGVVGMAGGGAGLWVLQEAVRGRWPFGGFPWGRLAFSQADAPTAGLAAVGGAPLVTAAVALAGGLLAWVVWEAWTLWRSRATSAPRSSAASDRQESESQGRRRLRTLVPAAGALAVLAVGLAMPLPGAADGEQVRVAAIQGNVPRAGLEFNAERRAVLDNHANATLELARRVAAGTTPAPQLVVWPENASDIDPLRNADAAAVISAAVDAIGVPTLVGTLLREPADKLSNTTLVWSPGTGPGERYIKQHPVPFGEYIPYRSFFRRISDKVDLVRRDFAAGDRTGLLNAGPARVGDVICFEVAYDGLVHAAVAQGADLLVVQTNNATFGYTNESVQQLAMSRLRAIESGRSVVHISTVGISALIAPDGTVMRRSGHFRRDVLEGAVPLRTEFTWATRVGAAPEWLIAGAGVVLVAAGGWGRRRRVSSGDDRRSRQVTEAGP